MRVWPQVLARWRSVAAALCQYSGAAVRAHLALFYFYGCYYHWSKRATGDAVMLSSAAMSCEESLGGARGAPGGAEGQHLALKCLEILHSDALRGPPPSLKTSAASVSTPFRSVLAGKRSSFACIKAAASATSLLKYQKIQLPAAAIEPSAHL